MIAAPGASPFRSPFRRAASPTRSTFTYYPGAIRIPETAAPPMKNNSWTLTAKLNANGADTEGVVVGFGGLAAGLSLYFDGGVPVFDYNYFDDHTTLKGSEPLSGDSDGRGRLRLRGRRQGRRSCDGDAQGERRAGGTAEAP